jgi:hypothetical protein
MRETPFRPFQCDPALDGYSIRLEGMGKCSSVARAPCWSTWGPSAAGYGSLDDIETLIVEVAIDRPRAIHPEVPHAGERGCIHQADGTSAREQQVHGVLVQLVTYPDHIEKRSHVLPESAYGFLT